jgi:hypothetical protein
MLLVLQLVALGLVGHAAGVPSGFPLDDAWIHQTVGRVLAETGTLGFAHGMHGAGATSWLWAALLALNYGIVHAAPALFTAGLNVLFYFSSGQLLLGLLRRDGAREIEALLLAAAATISGNFVWFVLSGMEASLVVLLSVLCIHSWFRDESTGSALVSALALVGLFFTRPETLGIVPVLWLCRRRARRDLVWLAVAALLSVSLYAGLNQLYTGTPFPATLAGRRWLWLLPFEGWSEPEIIGNLLLTWADRLAEYTLGSPAPLLFYPALGFAAFGFFTLLQHRLRAATALVVWSLVHLATYACLLPAIGHGGRYQPLVPSVFCFLVCRGLLEFGADLTRVLPPIPVLRQGLALAPALALAWPLGRGLIAWGSSHALAVAHVDHTEVGMGRALHRLPASDRVASFDAGGIAFFADRPILELGGLTEPALVLRIERGELADYLREQGANLVILPLGYDPSFPDYSNFGEILGLFRNQELELELVQGLGTSTLPWIEGARATMHAAPRQVLYRLHFRPERAP